MQSIGKIIESKLREKGISVSEFARRINTNRNNVYDIFRRDSVDTQLLQKISAVLDYDFFQYFNMDTNPNTNMVEEPTATYQSNYADWQQKIRELEKEILYLKERLADKDRIIELLEQQKKV